MPPTRPRDRVVFLFLEKPPRVRGILKNEKRSKRPGLFFLLNNCVEKKKKNNRRGLGLENTPSVL